MTYYWYGGSGNWSDYTNHWSFNSGNSPASPCSVAPTINDDVVFNTASHTTNYTVTMDAVTAYCKTFTMGAPASGKVTMAGSSAMDVGGSWYFNGGTAAITCTWYGTPTFKATSGTMELGFNDVGVYCVVLNGSGATFKLTTDLTCYGYQSYTGYSFALIAGNFDANGKCLNITNTSINGGIVRGNFTGSNAFYDFKRTLPSGVQTGYLTIYPGSEIVVTHTIYLEGYDSSNRLCVKSYYMDDIASITITGTTGNSFKHVDFQNINLITGGADLDLSAITGLSGNCGNNTGMVLTTPSTMYYYKASGNANWTDSANWYLGSGGTGGAGRMPLPQDTAVFDSNSFGSNGMTVTLNAYRAGSITWAGNGLGEVRNNPTFTTSSTTTLFGSLTLVNSSKMTLTASTQQLTFAGVGNVYLTSAGQTWAKDIMVNGYNTNLIFKDDYVSTTRRLYTGNGNYDASVYNVNITCLCVINATHGQKEIRMGSGTWTIVGNHGDAAKSVWSFGAEACTIYPGTSTLRITDSTSGDIYFNGTSQTYYNISFDRGTSTGAITIAGNNTFYSFTDTGTEAHTIKFTSSNTQIFTNEFNVSGSLGKLITIQGTTATKHTLSKSSGIVKCDFLDISNSTATGGARWYAGSHSNNTTGNSGWIFEKVPEPYFNLKMSKDSSQLKNRVYVRGGTKLSDTATYSTKGDGVKRQFVLPDKPHDVTVTVNSVSKTVGIKNINLSGYDWYLNYNEKYIEQDSGGTVLATTDTLVVSYKYDIPILVAVEDRNSITDYGTKEFAIFDKSISTTQAARDRASAELTDYANNLVEGSFETYEGGFRSGQYIYADLPDFGIDETYIIQKVTAISIGGGSFIYQVDIASAKTMGIIRFLIELLEANKNLIELNDDEVVDELFQLYDLLISDSITESLTIDSAGLYSTWCTSTETTPITRARWDLFQW